MKKLLLILIAQTVIISTIYSQERIFKPFKLDVGFLYDTPVDDEAGAGGGFYLEPKYGATDKLYFGLRIEGAFLSSGTISTNLTSVKIKASSVFPILFTSDYYFTTERVRPYVGLGLGLYRKGEQELASSINSFYVGIKSTTNFGVAPRIGLNFGRFKLAAIYNITGKNISDYLGIQVGVEIGGGRIK